MLPPATIRRPSASSVWPLQKTRYALVTGVNPPFGLAGSQSCASPRLPQSSTLPVGSRCRWIATTGVANALPHLPFAAASLVPEANAAVMVRAWIAVYLQVAVPLHGSVQPVKLLPLAAAAVSVSAVLAGYEAEHPVAAATPLVTTQSSAGVSPA